MRYARLLVLFLFALVARPASAQGLADPVPPYATNEGYPILPRLSGGGAIKMMAKLGLHPMYLSEDRIMYNYYRNLKRDVVDTLRKGMLVYADATDTPRYKASCWNRLREMLRCPKCITSASSDSATTADSLKKPAALFAGTSAWSRYWSGVEEIFLNFLKIFLAALLIALLAWLIYHLLRLLGRGMDWLSHVGITSDPEVPAPPASMPPPSPQQATRAPTMVNTPPTPSPSAVSQPEPISTGGHTVLVTAHPDGSHSIHSSPGVNGVDMMRLGTNNIDVSIRHDGHE